MDKVQELGSSLMVERLETCVRFFMKAGKTIVILTDAEMVKLVAWWHEQCYAQADAESDLVSVIVGLVSGEQISDETAIVAIRALMAQDRCDTLNGWVMPGE